MPRHDFICGCGHIECDVITPSTQIACRCGNMMTINFGAIRFNHHWDAQHHNTMYGTYHHGFGCNVESYEHKQELLKKHNVSEAADPVNGSRSWRDHTRNVQSESYGKAVELSESDVAALMRGDKSKTEEVSRQFERKQ